MCLYSQKNRNFENAQLLWQHPIVRNFYKEVLLSQWRCLTRSFITKYSNIWTNCPLSKKFKWLNKLKYSHIAIQKIENCSFLKLLVYMSVNALKNQKHQIPGAGVTWVPGTKLGSSPRTVHTLNCWAVLSELEGSASAPAFTPLVFTLLFPSHGRVRLLMFTGRAAMLPCSPAQSSLRQSGDPGLLLLSRWLQTRLGMIL